ncbi:MAG TPA: hypothetical protein VNS63_22915 [Blastocatellia bacterium]|nr:hypothetical protein [Blastocatellia bacterium]
MAETQEKHLFSFQELAEALVKKQGLHEGLWSIYIEFGIGAANFNTTKEPKELVPAAIVPVKSVGLLRSSEENNITVDASKVNPKTETVKAKASKSKRKRV